MVESGDSLRVLVFGASGVLGSAIASKFLEEGHTVGLVHRANPSSCASIVENAAAQDRSVCLRTDITQEAEIVATFSAFGEFAGGVDSVVNAVGINSPTDFDCLSSEDWLNLLNVNLVGAYLVAKSAVPYLENSPNASLTSIGSVSGQIGGPRTAHYAASKMGLMSLSQVFSRFGGARNIRSNVVSPGYIESEMASAGMEDPSVRAVVAQIPLGRLGTAAEVAAATTFLASAAARYITGQTISVNGGLYFSI